MKFSSILFLSIFISFNAFAQKKQPLVFSKTAIDYGRVEQWISKIDTVHIKNNGKEPLSLLLTTPPKDVEIKWLKKPIQPGETTFLVYIYMPKEVEKFAVKIPIYHSASSEPVELRLTGEVLSFTPDAFINCPSFSKPPPETSALVPIEIKNPSESANSNISEQPVFSEVVENIEPSADLDTELPLSLFKPNNVVFLIDVSNSMNQEGKLPFLKQSMINLLMNLRDIDKLTIVTYAGMAKVVLPSTTAENKEYIAAIINSLTAKGPTKPGEGLQKAYEAAFENFITEGNNQVILASDGKFEFMGEPAWKLHNYVKRQSAKGVSLSVAAFGNQASSLELLNELSLQGAGQFIHISSEEEAENALLEEIKLNSRR